MKSTFNIKNLFLFIGLGTVIAGTTVSCKDDPLPPAPSTTIVDIAAADPTLSILVSAVTKAGLVDALKNTANLTVFAPTNDAFIASGFPQSAIDALTPAQITSVLTPILTYHVVGAKVMAAGVPASDTVKTLNGLNIFASKNANGVFVNGIKVTTADIAASNGVIHKISSKVLVPPTQTIAEIVIADPRFALLEIAVIHGGLAGALSGPGKFTVFAPENAGFPTTLDSKAEIEANPSAAVGAIVLAHAFGTNIFAGDLTVGETPFTLNPLAKLTIGLSPNTVKISGSTATVSGITAVDIVAKNGVIHRINKILL